MKKKPAQFSTALYIRLSKEDGDKTESLSISNQRRILKEFINKQDDLCLYDEYVDDGFSGTNFDRPDFQRMITDIENKKVQCVLVKDLSRLGRNMPKVSEYINEYFPSKKVRFIAVNDMIDKQYYDIDISEDMMIDVKNLFNGFIHETYQKKSVLLSVRNKKKVSLLVHLPAMVIKNQPTTKIILKLMNTLPAL